MLRPSDSHCSHGSFSQSKSDISSTTFLLSYQNVLALGKADGDLSGLAADVHQLGILV